MSKSVLVIRTPENCKSCIHIGTFSDFCRVNCRDIKDPSVKPDWCPLRLLPEEDYENHYPDEWEDGYADGWNACIREIMGEQK